MFKILKPIKTILLIIVFMFLAVVASVSFGNNESSKIKLEENYFWQMSKNTISFFLLGADSFSKLELDNKFDFLKIKTTSNQQNLDELNFSNINNEFQNKLERIKLENKFSNFLSFFKAKFDKLDEEMEAAKN